MSELTLRDASVDDSGIYVCLATNIHGSLASDFQLTVQGKLKKMLKPTMLFTIH